MQIGIMLVIECQDGQIFYESLRDCGSGSMYHYGHLEIAKLLPVRLSGDYVEYNSAEELADIWTTLYVKYKVLKWGHLVKNCRRFIVNDPE